MRGFRSILNTGKGTYVGLSMLWDTSNCVMVKQPPVCISEGARGVRPRLEFAGGYTLFGGPVLVNVPTIMTTFVTGIAHTGVLIIF